MIQASQIEQLANEHLASRPELFLVDIKVKIGNKISIRIDSDRSVLIEDCKSLSKFIEENLDREKDDFELEVSSAGIDFPLVNTRQYFKNLGRTVQVMTTEGNLFKGALVNADTNQIVVANEKKQKGKKALKQGNIEEAINFFEQIHYPETIMDTKAVGIQTLVKAHEVAVKLYHQKQAQKATAVIQQALSFMVSMKFKP